MHTAFNNNKLTTKSLYSTILCQHGCRDIKFIKRSHLFSTASVRTAVSLTTFRQQLKTVFYQQCFC